MSTKFREKEKVICISTDSIIYDESKGKIIRVEYQHKVFFIGSDGIAHENRCYEPYRKEVK